MFYQNPPYITSTWKPKPFYLSPYWHSLSATTWTWRDTLCVCAYCVVVWQDSTPEVGYYCCRPKWCFLPGLVRPSHLLPPPQTLIDGPDGGFMAKRVHHSCLSLRTDNWPGFNLAAKCSLSLSSNLLQNNGQIIEYWILYVHPKGVKCWNAVFK